MYREPVGYLLKQITDKIKVLADASLKSRGLTLSQVRVMEFVSDHTEGVTQKAIEEYFQVSHPTIVGIITRMEKNGYLECWLDPGDKRNKMVCLTPKARSIAMEMKQEREGWDRKILKGLSEEQTDRLYEALYQIFENVSEKDDTA